MNPIPLQTIAAWASATYRPPFDSTPAPAAITALSIDSRKLAPGTLFFALPGERADGHDFLSAVAPAGAAAVVRADYPADRLPASAALLIHPDPEAALLAIARAYRQTFAPPSTTVVAITGSLGKTTTKELTADSLSVLGPTIRTAANLNNQLGLPLSLSRLETGTRFGVFEVGISHPGEMPPLADAIRPDAVLYTTIGPVHLENFPSVEAIAEEKACILDALVPGGIAVLDASSPYYPILRRHALPRRARILTTAPAAAHIPADYLSAPDPADPIGRALITETATSETVSLPLPPPGAHMVANLLPAVALARTLGASWDALRDVLRAPSAAPMRWERSTLADTGLHLINDAYNANPISMSAAIDAFLALPAPTPDSRRHLAVGPMLELGPIAADAHQELGRHLAQAAATDSARVASVTILDTYPPASPLAHAIADAYVAAHGPAPVLLATDYPSAAAHIRAHARPSDLLLLKASRGLHLEKLVPLL